MYSSLPKLLELGAYGKFIRRAFFVGYLVLLRGDISLHCND